MKHKQSEWEEAGSALFDTLVDDADNTSELKFAVEVAGRELKARLKAHLENLQEVEPEEDDDELFESMSDDSN